MTHLRRALGRLDATALVVASIIGTGILLKPALMAQEAGSTTLVFVAWVAAGLLALAGALTYAELGALFPHAGGEYVFIREAYGDAPAFLYGCTRYLIGGAAIAAQGVAFATFLAVLVPIDGWWPRSSGMPFAGVFALDLGPRQIAALATIAMLTLVNCAGVLAGGRLQTALAMAKVGGLLLLVGGLSFAVLRGGGSPASAAAPVVAARGGIAGFGAATLAALWAYAGWHVLPMVAGEVKEPRRTIPWALTVGMLAVMAVYLLVNTAFIIALPLGEIAASSSTRFPDAPSVANRAADVLLGTRGAAFAAVLFLLATAGTLNGALLGTSRVPFAMARDGLAPAALGRVERHSGAPVWAIAALGALAALLALTGTFDQLSTTVVFFYCATFAAVGGAVIVLRVRRPGVERPYRVVGYPWVPGVLVVGSAWLVVSALRTNTRESLLALGMLLASAVLYPIVRHRAGAAPPPEPDLDPSA